MSDDVFIRQYGSAGSWLHDGMGVGLYRSGKERKMSTDFLQITGFENGEFQLCPLDKNGADKLRLEVAVGIVKDMAANYPEGSVERWAVKFISELLESA